MVQEDFDSREKTRFPVVSSAEVYTYKDSLGDLQVKYTANIFRYEWTRKNLQKKTWLSGAPKYVRYIHIIL